MCHGVQRLGITRRSTEGGPHMCKESTRAADLDAIAGEWPVIEAELALVEAECRLAAAPEPLAVRAHRRGVARTATRIVPASPELITLLRQHIEDFGAGPEGRLFV